MDNRFSPRAKLIFLWVCVSLGVFFVARVPHVLAPFIWALVTAYILQPLINSIVRFTHARRAVVAVLTYCAFVAGMVLAFIALLPIVRTQAFGLSEQLPSTVSALSDRIVQRFPDLATQLGLDTLVLENQLRRLTSSWSASAPRTALTLVQRVVGFLIEFFVYLIATFYFLLQGDRIVRNIRNLLAPRYHREVDQLLDAINATLGAYLRGQLLLVIIMSGVTYLALSVLGVQYTIILALATGFLELIPVLGPWTAGAIAVGVAALQPTTPFGWSHATLAIVVGITYFVLRQLEDNLVIPTLIGRIVHLHPLVMIFILLVGTKAGGMLGLLLAIPLAAVLKILVVYLYHRAMAEEDRRVVPVEHREQLTTLHEDLAELAGAQVVLLTQPGALAWDDLPLLHDLALAAPRAGVSLMMVTQDAIAGSLATAVGIPTTVIPTTTVTATAKAEQVTA